MPTMIANNFTGNLTRYPNGSLQSGNAIQTSSWGYSNFKTPGALSFMDAPYSIGGSVVTDAIICGLTRVENGINYVYAVGHTGRLYKIQVNSLIPAVGMYDVPTLITTLTTATSFTQGGTINFFGSTEKIYIGHDMGVTSINFNGTGETFIGDVNQWIQNVPRQGVVFKNNLFYSNGSNISTINQSGIVTNYNSLLTNVGLSPVSTTDFIIKDLDVDSTGKYIVIISSDIPNVSVVAITPNVNATYGATSNITLWDTISPTVNNIVSIPSYDQTAIVVFGGYQYVFGYDLTGGIMSSLSNVTSTPMFSKLITNIFSQSPMPNAANSNGNITGWITPEYDFSASKLVAALFLYGSLDQSWSPTNFYRQIRLASTLLNGDILRVPWSGIVSNFQFGGSTSGYGGNVIGFGRQYFSTVERNSTTSAYKLYAHNNVPTGSGVCLGVYETQALLSTQGVFLPTAVRVYMQPATGTESFTIDLIGIDGNPITSSSHTFSPSASLTVLPYTPTGAASAAIGIRITNASTTSTPTIFKIEVDYTNQ